MDRHQTKPVKKAISVILTLVLMTGLFSVSAFAEEIPVTDQEQAEIITEGSADVQTITGQAAADRVETILSGMTLDEKISQMIIPAIRSWNGTDVTELSAADGLAETLRKHQYGGIILYGQNITDTEQVARLISDLQKNNAAAGATTHIPYFMPVDEEGGIVLRLNTGTRMTGSMAIGATGEDAKKNAEMTGNIIGEELRAVGFNIDFAPDADVNSNPANPVIGTRSFSDDPDTVAVLATAYDRGLRANGIIGTYKHFPGHGDTGTDSHIGAPCVNKTLEELMQMEFVPFKAAIDQGAEMIMTEHVTMPEVDDSVILADGSTGYYPATMSKKIMTDILRGMLGFDGVIVTDALEMGGIDKEKLVPGEAGSIEYFVNVAEKVINAGVDILLLPVDMTSPVIAAGYDAYIESLAAKVNNGTISMTRIDESVTRILRLKEKYGILDLDTSGEGIEETVENAKQIVGSAIHHDIEKEMAESAITMVKNDAQTLPFEDTCRNLVLIGRTQADTVSLKCAVDRMRKEGLLPIDAYVNNLASGEKTGDPNSGVKITIDYYYVSSGKPMNYSEELQQAVKAAEQVVILSVSWGVSDISANAVQYQAVSTIIGDAHRSGGKAVLISSNLPYDSARYQNADAILLTYMSSGTGIDPTERTASGSTGAYNANIQAAFNVAFGIINPSGRLPVNVLQIVQAEDGTVSYSDQILYERGYGLSYENPLKVTAKDTVSIEYPASAKETIAVNRLITVSDDAIGELSYRLVSVNKNSECFSVNAHTGNVTVKKGTQTGTYKLKIEVTAAGNFSFPEVSKTVTAKISVEKIKNTIKVKPGSKTIRFNKLKKKAQSFTLKATVKENAKTTFSLVSVSKKAEKYIKVSSSGKVTVKKGLGKGTYTLKIRVTTNGTKNYRRTVLSSKKIKIYVK